RRHHLRPERDRGPFRKAGPRMPGGVCHDAYRVWCPRMPPFRPGFERRTAHTALFAPRRPPDCVAVVRGSVVGVSQRPSWSCHQTLEHANPVTLRGRADEGWSESVARLLHVLTTGIWHEAADCCHAPVRPLLGRTGHSRPVSWVLSPCWSCITSRANCSPHL